MSPAADADADAVMSTANATAVANAAAAAAHRTYFHFIAHGVDVSTTTRDILSGAIIAAAVRGRRRTVQPSCPRAGL